jgi:hypothetical protein
MKMAVPKEGNREWRQKREDVSKEERPGADPAQCDLAKTSCFGKNAPHPAA